VTSQPGPELDAERRRAELVRFGYRCWPFERRVYLSLLERIEGGELHNA
jgi:hypothetical protein